MAEEALTKFLTRAADALQGPEPARTQKARVA
jgi:hypothetical protein